ncbi:MAG: type II secretion system F family protein, partial [Candidatus Omnitrophota bacterium]
MKFIYKAKKGPEEIVEGVIEAVNQENAVTKIREMGLFPVTVRMATDSANKVQVSTVKKDKPLAVSKKNATKGRVSKKHIYLFTKKLKVLIKSQEPILRSLYFLEDQISNAEFKKVLQTIIASVKDGNAFSDSLAKFPKHFDPLYISIIKAGEAGGKLDYAMEQIAGYMEGERQMAQKVISSLAYPAVMVSVGFASIIFILTFVVPKLTSLFVDLGDRLPFVTKVLLNVSSFFSQYWIIIFGFFIAVGVFLVYTKNTPWQKKVMNLIKKKIPVINNIIYNQSLCRFSGGLSILLSSGVPLLDSIRIAVPLVGDDDAKRELNNACRQIVGGAGLEESLRDNCTFLPDMFIRMVAVGEASGRLDEILVEVGQGYAEEVETATKIVTSLIEPLAILIVGGILGFIV